MKGDWINVTLNNLADITMGQSPKSEFYNLESDGLPFFQGCSEFGELYPVVKKYCSKPTRIAQNNDVLMSVRAPVGALNISNKECCIGRGLCAIKSKAGNRFIYYLLKANLEKIISYSGGTTYQSINKKEVNNLPFFVPPSASQHKIASILSAYDDLIENNTRLIAILEEMAQRIYREWFVDFKYPGYENDKIVGSELGMIPEGWEVKVLGDKIKFKRGKNITKRDINIGKIPVVAAGKNPAYYHNKSNVVAPVATVSASGANAGYINFYYEDIWASDCSFFNKDTVEYIYFYYSLVKQRQIEITGLQRGSAQPHVYPKDIEKIGIVTPPKKLIINYENLVDPIFNQIGISKEKNTNLYQTRDLLVPKLISGTIDVSEMDLDI